MGKILIVILTLVVLGILWALPLWACANLVCWVFHLSFHLTLLQAFALCALATVIHKLLFKVKEVK